MIPHPTQRIVLRRREPRMTRRSALLVVISTFSACTSADSAAPTVRLRDSAGVRIVEHLIVSPVPACSVAAAPTFALGGVIAAPEQHMIDDVQGTTELSDESIAVAVGAAAEVRVFDKSGRFVRSIGRRGNGPGEFRNLSRLWFLPPDTIVVADYRPWRLQYFTTDGRFHRSVTPQPQNVNRARVAELLPNGELIQGYPCCLTSSAGFHPQNLTLTKHDRNGVLVDTIAVLPYGEWGQTPEGAPHASWTFPLFEAFSTVTAAGHRIVLGDQSREELLFIQAGANPELVLRWKDLTDDSRKVPSGEVETYRRKRSVPVRPEIQWTVDDDLSPARPIRNNFPAFSDLLGASDGSVWVRLYRRPSETDTATYRYFRNNRPVCGLKVRVPTTILFAGNGHIILHERGESDVERVARYEVLSPNAAREH